MEMQFKNEIKKLADIVVWADNWIEELKSGLTEEEFEEDAEVKEFEAVKKAVLDSMERHTVYTNALNKDIADKAAKIDLLEKEIEGHKEGYTALKELMDTKYISIEEHNNICKKAEDTIQYYEDEIKSLNDEVGRRRNAYLKDSEFIVNIKKELEDWKERERTKSNMLRDAEAKIAELEEKVKHQRENLNAINKTLEIKTKENERLIAVKNNKDREIEAHESENARLSEKIAELKRQNEYLKKELDESYKAWDKDSKNHQKRDMTLVDELGKKNDEIKKLKEENSYLKKESKNKNDIIRKAYVRYVDEACKGREEIMNEIMNECYEKLTKDDTGYTGFKQYTLRALEAEEGNEKKTKEFLCDSAEIIFYNKRAEEKRKEETKKELNEAFGIPCGSDAIE